MTSDIKSIAGILRADWVEDALCADKTIVPDPEIFFVSDANAQDRNLPVAREARSICMRCPVREECNEWAEENGEDFGMWGGVWAKERRLGMKGDGNAV